MAPGCPLATRRSITTSSGTASRLACFSAASKASVSAQPIPSSAFVRASQALSGKTTSGGRTIWAPWARSSRHASLWKLVTLTFSRHPGPMTARIREARFALVLLENVTANTLRGGRTSPREQTAAARVARASVLPHPAGARTRTPVMVGRLGMPASSSEPGRSLSRTNQGQEPVDGADRSHHLGDGDSRLRLVLAAKASDQVGVQMLDGGDT